MAASLVTITSLSIDAVGPRANSPVHCFPREGLAVFIHALADTANSSDTTLTRRGMCRTQAWLTSSPTHCCAVHTVSDTETLELLKHNVHRRLSVLQASLCLWAPLWKCLAERPPLCGVYECCPFAQRAAVKKSQVAHSYFQCPKRVWLG